MSWQEEYNKRYEARLAEKWRPNGKKVQHRNRGHSVTFDNLSPVVVENVRLSMEEFYNSSSELTQMLWNNFMNTREICGND